MKTLEVVVGILIQDNKILACQRGEHQYIANQYEFPGGKVESGETQVDALKRELTEELNIEIEGEKHFLSLSHEYPTFKVNLHAYICQIKKGDIELKEHLESRWLDKDTLFTVDWVKANTPILEKLIKDGILK